MRDLNLTTSVIILSVTFAIGLPQVALAKLLEVTEGKKPASKDLSIKKSAVPTWTKMNKSKDIPRLDIGSEDTLKAGDFVVEIKLMTTKPISSLQTQPSPPVPNSKNFPKVDIADEKKAFKAPFGQKIPSLSEPQLPAPAKVTEVTPIVKDLNVMSAAELKQLQGLILFEMADNKELALGLFAELLADAKWKEEAAYQYGLVALKVGLNNEFQDQLFTVMTKTKNKELARSAWLHLWENARHVPVDKLPLLEEYSEKLKTDKSHSAGYLYNRGLYLTDSAKMQEAFDLLSAVKESDPEYLQAQFHLGIILYRTNQVEDAIDQLNKVLKLTENDKTNVVRSYTAMTLARLKFQQGEYKESYNTYLQIDKNNSLWLQAMVEQAWTQIMSKDYEGAAGNMFSLHTDFFKNNYAPESYLVRTVSYLNLCQYGDGIKVLETMKRKYAPLKNTLDHYLKTHTEPGHYYDLVKNWLQHSDLKVMEGIPQSFLLELAKYPVFQTEQNVINKLEDESSLFNKLSLDILKKEKDLLQKLNEVNTQLAAAKSGSRMPSSENVDERLLSYNIQHMLAKKARTLLKPLREAALIRLDKEKANVRLRAAKAIHNKFKALSVDLARIIDQNEVLQYELYSGAGEHIRYQLAGGEINTDKRPELQAEKGKSVTWKFQGEIWADELGHYRSSLKNVCASDEKNETSE